MFFVQFTFKIILGDGSTSTEVDSSSSSSNVESEANEVSGGSTPGTALKMPALSPTMTEGTIVNWNKKVNLIFKKKINQLKNLKLLKYEVLKLNNSFLRL